MENGTEDGNDEREIQDDKENKKANEVAKVDTRPGRRKRSAQVSIDILQISQVFMSCTVVMNCKQIAYAYPRDALKHLGFCFVHNFWEKMEN